jgi:hypothetical protein
MSRIIYYCQKLLGKAKDVISVASVFINAVESQVLKLTELIPWCRVIEKLLVAQLGKKILCPVTWKFWPCSQESTVGPCVEPGESILYHTHFLTVSDIIILYHQHLCFRDNRFPHSFLTALYAFIIFFYVCCMFCPCYLSFGYFNNSRAQIVKVLIMLF